jgi:hypothetical protein
MPDGERRAFFITSSVSNYDMSEFCSVLSDCLESIRGPIYRWRRRKGKGIKIKLSTVWERDRNENAVMITD